MRNWPIACTLTPRVATIDVATLRDLLEARAAGRAAFNLLDVREENEWAINRLDGAVHVPLGRVLDDPAAVLAGLEPGPVYVYCLAGVRSLRAAGGNRRYRSHSSKRRRRNQGVVDGYRPRYATILTDSVECTPSAGTPVELVLA